MTPRRLTKAVIARACRLAPPARMIAAFGLGNIV